MFDLHSEMYTFYDTHVLLDADEKNQLAEYRDRNIHRLKDGLKKLGYKVPVRTPTQGGYAMNTLTQRPENNPDVDHDIDIATIFEREDLPEDALDARKRVLAGVVEGGGNFKKDPEARTNAVTVWYQENYHVDLAVHRVYTNDFGEEVIEHAGASWSPRDPMDITNWFKEKVKDCSPSSENGATVASHQMQRIVQLLKYFSKSRSSWNLPGGLIISALVAECYCPDYHRDDSALYKTMEAIHHRLQGNLLQGNFEVYNPVDRSQQLTYKDEYINQVRRFKDRLEDAIRWLTPLFETDCGKEDALKAWGQVFKHSYWEKLAEEIEAAKAMGEQLRAARVAGSLYVGQSGQLFTSKPEGKSVQVPKHRDYGEGK
jgi:hypothetical protein